MSTYFCVTLTILQRLQLNNNSSGKLIVSNYLFLISSVSDPFHFDKAADPRIRPKIEKIPLFSSDYSKNNCIMPFYLFSVIFGRFFFIRLDLDPFY